MAPTSGSILSLSNGRIGAPRAAAGTVTVAGGANNADVGDTLKP
jgi:hypothetical protein